MVSCNVTRNSLTNSLKASCRHLEFDFDHRIGYNAIHCHKLAFIRPGEYRLITVLSVYTVATQRFKLFTLYTVATQRFKLFTLYTVHRTLYID